MAVAPRAKAPVNYVARIRRYDWVKLRSLWTKIDRDPRRPVPKWAAGKALEHLVLRAFELSGAEVVWPYSVELQGQVVEQIDGMVIAGGITCLVEIKDQKDNVNVEPLAKLRNQLLRRPAGVVGSVFSSSGFTDPAITLGFYMAPQAILFWQGPEIRFLLDKEDFVQALRAKHRALMQFGKPDFDARAAAI